MKSFMTCDIFLSCAGHNCVQHNYTYSPTIAQHVLENFSFLAQMYKTARSGQLSPYSDSLWIVRSGVRAPVGAKFSFPVQTGLWDQLAVCNEENRVFRGGKAAGV